MRVLTAFVLLFLTVGTCGIAADTRDGVTYYGNDDLRSYKGGGDQGNAPALPQDTRRTGLEPSKRTGQASYRPAWRAELDEVCRVANKAMDLSDIDVDAYMGRATALQRTICHGGP